jgi:hypothetical protein
MAKRIRLVMRQRYNEITFSFPTALLAGMFMDEAIVSADADFGELEFRITVEDEEEKDTEEKEDDVDGIQTSES